MSKININIKVKDIKKADKYDSHLIFDLIGDDINHVLMNTIRRGIMEYIPTYAFDSSYINITENTSVYDNDEMKIRLSLTPLINIKNERSTLDNIELLEYETNRTIYDKKIEDVEIKKKQEDKKLMEKLSSFIMKFDCENTTQNIIHITTNDVKFIYNTKLLKESPYKYPLKIISLKPGEKFIGECYSLLNIPLYNAIYLPCSLCSYIEENPNNYTFTLESLGQIDEKELLIRACIIIIKKLEKLNKVIIDKIESNINEIKNDNKQITNKNKSFTNTIKLTSIHDNNKINEYYNVYDGELKLNNYYNNINDKNLSPDNYVEEIDDLFVSIKKGIIKIEYESHTMGNLITYYLQDHPNIQFAGYKIDQLLIKELTIIYVTDGKSIIDIFNKVFNDIIKLFNHFIVLFESIKM